MPKTNLGDVRGESGLVFRVYATFSDMEELQEKHPEGTPDEIVNVGGTLHTWDAEHTCWVPLDAQTVALGDMQGEVELTDGEAALDFELDVHDGVADVTAKLKVPDTAHVEIPVFRGATEYVNGTTGTVPAPIAGLRDRALLADGTWQRVKVKGASEDDGTVPLSSLYTGLYGDTPIVKFGMFNDAAIDWFPIAINHNGMPVESVLIIAKHILALLCFDAMESLNPDAARRENGNNDWNFSNLKQWLNSNASLGWYSKQHSYDQPPSSTYIRGGKNPYQSNPGFLAQFSEKECSILLEMTRLVGSYSSNNKVSTDKITLLTYTETGLATYTNDGTKIGFFTNNVSRIATPTEQAVANNQVIRDDIKTGSGWNWWTSTSYASNGNNVLTVAPNGSNGGTVDAATSYMGVRPACCLPANTKCREKSEGVYEIVY